MPILEWVLGRRSGHALATGILLVHPARLWVVDGLDDGLQRLHFFVTKVSLVVHRQSHSLFGCGCHYRVFSRGWREQGKRNELSFGQALTTFRHCLVTSQGSKGVSLHAR